MAGSVLHPLNELRESAPEIWRREVAKYEGREQVLDMRVPLLDCLWNDVLHFSPVHPSVVVAALGAAGFEEDRRRFFEIGADLLDPAQTVVFLNSTDREHRFDPEQWSWFDASMVARLSSLPELTRAYYAECAREGWTPLRFAHVPHVLFRGSLDVSDATVVRV